jgi:tetratricopeptide (TPR) repeat protein
VIGQVFYVEAVERLCPEALRPEVRSSLDSLTRRELVGPDESTIAGQEAFRFHHILIRDAAYQGLLKRTRAELHEKFAGWLEDRAGDHDEILGYHLEQAVRSLAQLGPLDAHAAALGERAAGHLAAAGGRARARGDMPAAASLLRRASVLAPNVPARPRWLLHAGEALGEMGAFMTADEVLTSAAEQARAGGDVATAATATVVAQMWRYLANPEDARAEEVAAAGRAAISLLEQLEAHEGLARAWKLMMYVHFLEGRFSPAEECVTHAVHHAELAGDRVFEVRLLSALASCLVYSVTPVAEALARCGELLERGAGDRRTEAMTLAAMSHLEAMRGDAEAAREHYQRSRAMLTDLGFTLSAAITSLHSGPAEMLAGEMERAETELRADYETLQAMGDTGYAPTVAALLAEVLHDEGRDEEATKLAEACREKASPHDVGAQYQWRSIRARLLAAEGLVAEAEELARESVRLIRTTDQPDVQGQALAGLAEVLETAGRGPEAEAALLEAVALFEAKGNAVSAARSRRALELLQAAPVSGAAAPK